jgi:hypothetical protein
MYLGYSIDILRRPSICRAATACARIFLARLWSRCCKAVVAVLLCSPLRRRRLAGLQRGLRLCLPPRLRCLRCPCRFRVRNGVLDALFRPRPPARLRLKQRLRLRLQLRFRLRFRLRLRLRLRLRNGFRNTFSDAGEHRIRDSTRAAHTTNRDMSVRARQ